MSSTRARVTAGAAGSAFLLLAGAGPALAVDDPNYPPPNTGVQQTQVLPVVVVRPVQPVVVTQPAQNQTQPVVVVKPVVKPVVQPQTVTRTQTPARQLAFTGSDAVVGGLVLGSLLVAGGSVFVIAGRRRERTTPA